MSDNQQTNLNRFESEYTSLEKKSLWNLFYHQMKTESSKNEYSSSASKEGENKFLNRYRDVNPYDHSRVIISRPKFNYINASLVKVEDARRSYILTQGPLPSTIAHFWIMVWEQKSRAIVMLNKLIEKSHVKCSQYWPDDNNEDAGCLNLHEVDLTVELKSVKTNPQYIVRSLKLTNVVDNESRDVIQYHYTDWPDFGVPQSPLSFLKFLREIRQNGAFQSNVGPPIVHCSAGIGRSGTFCLVDSCLVLATDGIDSVSIKDVLLKMRTYRMGLIQTPDQLKFSYVAIIQGLKVDWEAQDNDGLPKDDCIPSVVNGNDSFTMILPKCPNNDNDDDDETTPPLPPTRNVYETNAKPLPNVPLSDSDSDETEPSSGNDVSILESSETGDDDTLPIDDIKPLMTKDVKEISCSNNAEVIGNSPPKPKLWEIPVPDVKKRKFVDESREKSERIQEKVAKMKKKQTDAENSKKRRSILNYSIGISFVAVSGAFIAYLWYRSRNS